MGTEDSLEGAWIDGGDLGGVDDHEAWVSLKWGPIGGNDAEFSDGGQKLELIQTHMTQKPMLRVEGQGACGWALFLGNSTGSLCYYSLLWGNSSSSRTSRPVNRTLLFLDNNGCVRSSQTACSFVALSSWITCDQVWYVRDDIHLLSAFSRRDGHIDSGARPTAKGEKPLKITPPGELDPRFKSITPRKRS